MPNPFQLDSRNYGGQPNMPARFPAGTPQTDPYGPDPRYLEAIANNDPRFLPPRQQGPAPTQYGYAQAPGGSYGYYAQQAPAGSFAAANQQFSQGANPAQNPYIGQTSTGIGGQGSVLPYAQQIAQ